MYTVHLGLVQLSAVQLLLESSVEGVALYCKHQDNAKGVKPILPAYREDLSRGILTAQSLAKFWKASHKQLHVGSVLGC